MHNIAKEFRIYKGCENGYRGLKLKFGMSFELSKIDSVYFLLKTNRLKNKYEIGDLLSTKLGLLTIDNFSYDVEEIVTRLLEYLADIGEYSKACSLKAPKVLLIPELVESIPMRDLIIVLTKVQHYNVKGKIGKEWCCSLHMLIAKHISQKILDSLVDIEDEKLVEDFMFLYETEIPIDQRMKLLCKFDEAGRLNKSLIEAILSERVYDHERREVYVSTLNRLQNRTELFVAVFRRIRTWWKYAIDLDMYLAVEPEWKWFLIAEDVDLRAKTSHDIFKYRTLLLAYGNDTVPDGTNSTCYYLSAYLKNVVSIPKDYWVQAMNCLNSEIISFDLEIAQVLYESDNAKEIIKEYMQNGLVPYENFCSRFQKHGAETGMFQHYKFNPDIGAKRQLKTMGNLFNLFNAYSNFNELDHLLNGSITRDFIPYILRKCEDVDKELSSKDIAMVCKLPVDALSMEDWKRLCFGCRTYKVIHYKSIAEVKQLLIGMEVVKNPKEGIFERIVSYGEEGWSVKKLLRLAFNPDIISADFRSYLLKRYLLQETVFKMHLEFLKHGDTGVKFKSSDKNVYISKDSCKPHKHIEDLIKKGEKSKCSWKCLFRAPPDDLIKSYAFWKYLSSDFIIEVTSKSQSREICKALEAQKDRSTLILLHTIMNTYFDSIRWEEKGESIVDSGYFWSKIFSEVENMK